MTEAGPRPRGPATVVLLNGLSRAATSSTAGARDRDGCAPVSFCARRLRVMATAGYGLEPIVGAPERAQTIAARNP